MAMLGLERLEAKGLVNRPRSYLILRMRSVDLSTMALIDASSCASANRSSENE